MISGGKQCKFMCIILFDKFELKIKVVIYNKSLDLYCVYE